MRRPPAQGARKDLTPDRYNDLLFWACLGILAAISIGLILTFGIFHLGVIHR